MGCATSCGCCCECTSGCPVNLDFACVFYHKDNTEISDLDGLALANGATLELVIETLDEKIKQIAVLDLALPYLKDIYTINTLQQYLQAVDTELELLKESVDGVSSSVPVVANDSATIDLTASGTLNHTLTASVKLSAASGNRLTAQTDGVHVSAQTLSVDATAKTLSITDGNTVSVAALLTAASGWLGSLTADPSDSQPGQYWYNSTSSLLKLRVSPSLVKVITTA